VQIWVVVFLSLCISNWAFVMSMVFLMGILMYKSLMSRFSSLWLMLIVSLVRLWARLFELSVV